MDEDAVLMAIGGLTAEVKNLGREMGEIKTGIQSCQNNCKENREKVSKRIAVLETFRTQVLAYVVAASAVITIAGNWIFSIIFGGSSG